MERRVEREGGVPFRQDETVSIRVAGTIAFEDAAVDRREDAGDGQARSYVSDRGSHRLFEHDLVDVVGGDHF